VPHSGLQWVLPNHWVAPQGYGVWWWGAWPGSSGATKCESVRSNQIDDR
jgi:hypothetical protein